MYEWKKGKTFEMMEKCKKIYPNHWYWYILERLAVLYETRWQWDIGYGEEVEEILRKKKKNKKLELHFHCLFQHNFSWCGCCSCCCYFPLLFVFFLTISSGLLGGFCERKMFMQHVARIESDTEISILYTQYPTGEQQVWIYDI